MNRLFVALALPDEVVKQLQSVAGGISGAKWAGPNEMHVTLRFIGEVSNTTLEEINTQLSQIRANTFTIKLTGVDIFTNGKRAHTLWVGIAKNPELIALHARIEISLIRAGLEPYRRKFTPHVTLARLRRARHHELEDFLIRHSLLRTSTFMVKSFILYSSRLSRSGASHQIENEYKLDELTLTEQTIGDHGLSAANF